MYQVNGQSEGEQAAAAIEDSIREAEQEVEKAEATAAATPPPEVTETKKEEVRLKYRNWGMEMRSFKILRIFKLNYTIV